MLLLTWNHWCKSRQHECVSNNASGDDSENDSANANDHANATANAMLKVLRRPGAPEHDVRRALGAVTHDSNQMGHFL